MSRFLQGRYKPINPKKYKGNVGKCVFRSSWEMKFFRWLDMHDDVIEWSSEEYIISYVSPIDNKRHRYFPDIVYTHKDEYGELRTVMVEIKPYNQTLPPKRKVTKNNKPTRGFITEVVTYGINQAKWEAAEAFCAKKNWTFVVLTEKNTNNFSMF